MRFPSYMEKHNANAVKNLLSCSTWFLFNNAKSGSERDAIAYDSWTICKQQWLEGFESWRTQLTLFILTLGNMVSWHGNWAILCSARIDHYLRVVCNQIGIPISFVSHFAVVCCTATIWLHHADVLMMSVWPNWLTSPMCRYSEILL